MTQKDSAKVVGQSIISAIIFVFIIDFLLLLYIGVVVSYLLIQNAWYGTLPIEDMLHPGHVIISVVKAWTEYAIPYFEKLSADFIARLILPPLAGFCIALTSAIIIWRAVIPRMRMHTNDLQALMHESETTVNTERRDTTIHGN